MAVAAFAGETVEAGMAAKKSRCLHPDKPVMFSCSDCPRRGGMSSDGDFMAAAALVSRRVRTVDELGLETPLAKKTTGEIVLSKVADMAAESSSRVSPDAVRFVAAQVLAALAATAGPLVAQADDAVPPAPPMMQMQQVRVSGRVTYSRLLEFVDEGSVRKVDLYDLGRTAVVLVKVGDREQQLVCDLPGATTGLIEKLQKKGVNIEVHAPEKPNEFLRARGSACGWMRWQREFQTTCSGGFVLQRGLCTQARKRRASSKVCNRVTEVLGDVAFPLLLIGGLLFLRTRGGGAGGIPGFGNQNKAKIMITPQTGVKFENVAGIDEAKEELTEIVDFLKAPERFVKVGAKIPRGVLLTGPPGTGKTLMAKALAGESGVPFIQSSASEFIELFVGVGASRVRDIFKQAKEKAPCIVFIDEIDAIGRQRGAGMGGGNDEREQTLNQILTEMDGFEGNSGVIVVAATNRPWPLHCFGSCKGALAFCGGSSRPDSESGQD